MTVMMCREVMSRIMPNWKEKIKDFRNSPLSPRTQKAKSPPAHLPQRVRVRNLIPTAPHRMQQSRRPQLRQAPAHRLLRQAQQQRRLGVSHRHRAAQSSPPSRKPAARTADHNNAATRSAARGRLNNAACSRARRSASNECRKKLSCNRGCRENNRRNPASEKQHNSQSDNATTSPSRGETMSGANTTPTPTPTHRPALPAFPVPADAFPADAIFTAPAVKLINAAPRPARAVNRRPAGNRNRVRSK